MLSSPRSAKRNLRLRPARCPSSLVTVSTATALSDALSAATEALAAAGVDTPRLDAELLLAAASGVDRTRLAADSQLVVEPAVGRAFAAMVRRRLRREPVAYILGSKGFRHITLACDRRALVPRPETELLVEIAVELQPGSVLDVGTGTGAVALAIADELPGAAVWATDTSEPALDLARENAARLGLVDRVRFATGTLPRAPAHAASRRPRSASPEPSDPSSSSGGRRAGHPADAAFELVVANLPYVPDGEWGSLAPEITDHEPRHALLGGPDGLVPIRSLLDATSPDAPLIALEVGAGQAGEVAALVHAAGFGRVEARNDLAGIERVVIGRR